MCTTFCSLPLRQYALASNNRGSMLTLTAFKSLLAAYTFNLFFTNHCICIFLVKNFRTILWYHVWEYHTIYSFVRNFHEQPVLLTLLEILGINLPWGRGGARNFQTEGRSLTGGLKWEKWNGKNAVFVHHFAKFPPTETRNFLQHRASDRGL